MSSDSSRLAPMGLQTAHLLILSAPTRQLLGLCGGAYAAFMTTRDELHHLVDRLQDGALDDAAAMLRQYARLSGEPPYPASVGMLSGAPTELSARVDDYLSGGFAR